MHTSTSFTSDTQATGQRVTADYGATDCGQFDDVLLALECHPESGQPAPLVTIMRGPGTPGYFEVIGSRGDPVGAGLSLAHAAQAARFEAVRSYRALGLVG